MQDLSQLTQCAEVPRFLCAYYDRTKLASCLDYCARSMSIHTTDVTGLLSYIASILQGPSGSAGACWASTPHAKAAYIPLRGGGFYRYMGHYVFMHFAPSFLPSRAGAVTRI